MPNLGFANIPILRTLVAAAKQQNIDVAALNEIYPIARPTIDPQFTHTLANRLHVTSVAQCSRSIRLAILARA
jgi:hypothetical protein